MFFSAFKSLIASKKRNVPTASTFAVNILGIHFMSGAHEEILEKCIKDGGYIIAPSAPTLVYAKENQYF